MNAYYCLTISYDAQGNPTSYLGHTLTWEKGRQLKSFDNNTYTYNANGIRTSKTVNGVEHIYTLDGSKILKECWNYNEDTKEYNDILIPLYDNEDSVCGILYNNTPYYFEKNLQGDIISIATVVDGEDGYKEVAIVARYTYDAWGKIVSIRNGNNNADISSDATHIANINPFRYRGYYYDTENEFYYIQSRYYDCKIGRFINIDGCFIWDVDKTIFSANLYNYCVNDPVNHSDVAGNTVTKIIIRAILGAIFGAAMQYLGDVLQNLLDCVIDKKKVTKAIWKKRSGMGDYIAAVVTSACDATLKIGVWKSIGISVAATIVGHLTNWARGKGFNFIALMKDLVWNALLSIVTNAICKKFKPKQGKQLNAYIRKKFKVKGTSAYKEYWRLMCECIEWNGYVISTFVSTLRTASRRILNFVEVILWDCIIKAFAKQY